MADYHAVLQRTLSSFSNPKPELRTKLYARARTTIARQLENRKPAVSAEAQQAELNKLEQAILEIERSYSPEAAAPQPAPPEPQDERPAVSTAPTVPVAEESVAAQPVVAEATTPEASQIMAPENEITEMAEAPASWDIASPDIPQPDRDGFATEPAQVHAEAGDRFPAPTVGHGEPVAEQTDTSGSVDLSQNDAAVDEWAKEFLTQQPVPVQSTAIPQPPLPEPDTEPVHPPVTGEPAAPPTEHAAAVASPPPTAPPPPALDPAFHSGQEESLVIPPAPGFGNGAVQRRKGGGVGKWLLILLFLAILGAAGAWGWMNRELVLETIGMSDLLDDPTRPKPVKTIPITPEPEEPEENSTAPEDTQPAKVESRLGAGGQEINPASADNGVPQAATPAIQPPIIVQQSQGTPPVAQSAILYEEGATAAENSVDAGRVVWSVTEDQQADGEGKMLAIQARIEIPERNVVLIMTIKRNADKALPASHLIELVFAVPDNFSGGGVGQISRFVLKQSEQGRGEGLIGVPARIADGIFLIALNNLEQARQKNESLLKTRDWIDIPIQYSTGRRALMTIEKGLPGAKVFDEVFKAWEKV